MSDDDLYDFIRESARDDGHFAIAYALLRLATQVKYLGGGDNASQMGAVEYLATRLDDQLGRIANALHAIAESQQ